MKLKQLTAVLVAAFVVLSGCAGSGGDDDVATQNEKSTHYTYLKGNWVGYSVTCYVQCDPEYDYYFREDAQVRIDANTISIETVKGGTPVSYDFDYKLSGDSWVQIELDDDQLQATVDYLDNQYLYLKIAPRSFASDFDYYVLQKY